MQELQHLAAWVKERYAQEYILTWLLSQSGLWWSDGEVYQAAMQKSGKLLKEYVQKKQEGEVFQGIADKLVKLQDPNRREEGVKKTVSSGELKVQAAPVLEVQQALPDPYSDPLTRR